jgi:hypothetical protein
MGDALRTKDEDACCFVKKENVNDERTMHMSGG